jgi:hypothetical protein
MQEDSIMCHSYYNAQFNITSVRQGKFLGTLQALTHEGELFTDLSGFDLIYPRKDQNTNYCRHFHVDVKKEWLIQELQAQLALDFSLTAQYREAILRIFVEHFERMYIKHYGV